MRYSLISLLLLAAFYYCLASYPSPSNLIGPLFFYCLAGICLAVTYLCIDFTNMKFFERCFSYLNYIVMKVMYFIFALWSNFVLAWKMPVFRYFLFSSFLYSILWCFYLYIVIMNFLGIVSFFLFNDVVINLVSAAGLENLLPENSGKLLTNIAAGKIPEGTTRVGLPEQLKVAIESNPAIAAQPVLIDTSEGSPIICCNQKNGLKFGASVLDSGVDIKNSIALKKAWESNPASILLPYDSTVNLATDYPKVRNLAIQTTAADRFYCVQINSNQPAGDIAGVSHTSEPISPSKYGFSEFFFIAASPYEPYMLSDFALFCIVASVSLFIFYVLFKVVYPRISTRINVNHNGFMEGQTEYTLEWLLPTLEWLLPTLLRFNTFYRKIRNTFIKFKYAISPIPSCL